MEVRIESMICVWDDAIPTMFLEFVKRLSQINFEMAFFVSAKKSGKS